MNISLAFFEIICSLWNNNLPLSHLFSNQDLEIRNSQLVYLSQVEISIIMDKALMTHGQDDPSLRAPYYQTRETLWLLQPKIKKNILETYDYFVGIFRNHL